MARLIVIWCDNEASNALRGMLHRHDIPHEAHRATDDSDQEKQEEKQKRLPVVLEHPGGYFEGGEACAHVEKICAHQERE